MFKSTVKNISFRMVVSLSIILMLVTLLSCAAEVETPPPPENTVPVIHYIEAPAETLPQTISDVDCVATDADSDNLTYDWTCTGGTVIGKGASVAWNSPLQAGSYDLNVMVSDGKGGEATQSTTIIVNAKPNAAPVVTGLLVTKEDDTHYEINPDDNTPVWLALWKTAVITCVVNDPDGDKVDLVWSASDGKIEGEGNTVTYIATVRGDFVVIVNASFADSAGRGLFSWPLPSERRR